MAQYPFAAVPQFATEATLTIASVASVTCPEQAFTVNGLRPEMTVLLTADVSLPANLGISHAYCNAANSLTIRFINPTALAITGAAVKFKVLGL